MKPNEHPGHVTLSAFFDTEEAVEKVLSQLLLMGIPRDLIEITVGQNAADRFYGGRAKRMGTQALPYAAIGALVGFLGAALVSLVIILFPGFQDVGLTAVVQLLGPNMGALLGALIGLLIGFFVRKKPRGHYARALERQAILLLVHDRSPDEIEDIRTTLEAAGGESPTAG